VILGRDSGAEKRADLVRLPEHVRHQLGLIDPRCQGLEPATRHRMPRANIVKCPGKFGLRGVQLTSARYRGRLTRLSMLKHEYA
jgi:hypothetical protein